MSNNTYMQWNISETVPQSSGSITDEPLGVMTLTNLKPSTSADLNFISGYICGKQPHFSNRNRNQEEENHKRLKNSTEKHKHGSFAGRERNPTEEKDK